MSMMKLSCVSDRTPAQKPQINTYIDWSIFPKEKTHRVICEPTIAFAYDEKSSPLYPFLKLSFLVLALEQNLVVREMDPFFFCP